MVRYAVTRTVKPRVDRTRRGSFPIAARGFASPRAASLSASLTWIGHATFLIQISGLNVLTDPVWSDRCSPVRFAGPRRYMPPGIPFDDLPPIDVVAISHDHYDHLDSETVARLAAGNAGAQWLVPLGLTRFVRDRGGRQITELDWGESARVENAIFTCVPAQHFSGRRFRRNRSLWCGWTAAGDGRKIYFVGDTGRHPVFEGIGARFGPFNAVIMPIGAYDPRWFMAPVHLDPAEAVVSHLELTRAAGTMCPMVGMHWGTFKLTDEPMTEPPERARAVWERLGLAPEQLWILRHGETRWLV